MKRHVTFFRRSKAEKESEVIDSSSHPENDSRDDTDTQLPHRVYRKTGYTVPEEVLELRRKRYRKRPEYGDDKRDSESDDGNVDDGGRYDQRRSNGSERHHNRHRRNGSSHYNDNDNNRTSHRRSSNLRHTHHDDDNNSSVREGSSTIRTYKTKVHRERKLQDNAEKRRKKYKDKLLKERLISDSTLELFPTKDNGEHTSKEITFSIVGFTKSTTRIDSDIVFIPVVVYPREKGEDEENSEISSNYHEESENNGLTKYENDFVQTNTKDFDNNYQQEPTSLDNNEHESTNNGHKSTSTYSFGNKMVTKGERQPCLESNNTLTYRVATPENIFQNEVASAHDVVSQKDEKLDEKTLLGVKNDNTKKVQLLIDKDTHNVYNNITSTKCLPMDESVSTLSGNLNPKLKEPSILDYKIETKPLYHTPSSGYLHDILKVPELTEPIDNNYTCNTNLEEASKPPTLDRKLEIKFKRKSTDIEMKKRNTNEPRMVNKEDEDNNLRLNKKSQVKEKHECGKENSKRGKNNYNPLTDIKENPRPLEESNKHYKDKTVSKYFHIFRAMYDDYDNTKDVFKQLKLKDKIYGVNGTAKVFGNIPQNETKTYTSSKIHTPYMCRVQEEYRSYPVTDTKWEKTISSKYFVSKSKEDYKTERPGFVTTLNCSGDPPIQKLNSMTHIIKTEIRESKKKENLEKSNRSEKLVEKSSPDENKTIEENKDEGITGMVGRYLMEGCHILLGTSVHSVVMDVINGFVVVNRKMQGNS